MKKKVKSDTATQGYIEEKMGGDPQYNPAAQGRIEEEGDSEDYFDSEGESYDSQNDKNSYFDDYFKGYGEQDLGIELRNKAGSTKGVSRFGDQNNQDLGIELKNKAGFTKGVSRLFVEDVFPDKKLFAEDFFDITKTEPITVERNYITDYDTNALTDEDKKMRHVIRDKRRKWGEDLDDKKRIDGEISAQLYLDWINNRTSATINGKYTPVAVTKINQDKARPFVKEYLRLTRGKHEFKLVQGPKAELQALAAGKPLLIVLTYGGSKQFIKMCQDHAFAWSEMRKQQLVVLFVPESDAGQYKEIPDDYAVVSWKTTNEDDKPVSGFGPTRVAAQYFAENINDISMSMQSDGNVNRLNKLEGQSATTTSAIVPLDDIIARMQKNEDPILSFGLGSGNVVYPVDRDNNKYPPNDKKHTYEIAHGSAQHKKMFFENGGRPVEQYFAVSSQAHFLRGFVTGGEDMDLTQMLKKENRKTNKISDNAIIKSLIEGGSTTYTDQQAEFQKYLYKRNG